MKYPRIEEYMNNKEMKLTEFAKQCGIPRPTMWRFVNGKADINKSNIDKILKVTGFTYEECFVEEKKVEWREYFANRFGRVE